MHPLSHFANTSFSFRAHLSVILHTLSVIPAKAGIQKYFSSNIREKNNIDSPLLISRITKNENNKEKERKHWIPNQVGDDIGVVFGDDIGVVFGDDIGVVFEDDN